MLNMIGIILQSQSEGTTASLIVGPLAIIITAYMFYNAKNRNGYAEINKGMAEIRQFAIEEARQKKAMRETFERENLPYPKSKSDSKNKVREPSKSREVINVPSSGGGRSKSPSSEIDKALQETRERERKSGDVGSGLDKKLDRTSTDTPDRPSSSFGDSKDRRAGSSDSEPPSLDDLPETDDLPDPDDL